MKRKIDIGRVRQIVKEELAALHEGEQHKLALDHADAAVKCLDALEKYKEVASEKAKAEFGDALDKVEQILNRIAESPLQYVDAMPTSDEDDLAIPSTGDGDVVAPSNKTRVVKPSVVKAGLRDVP